MWRRWMLLLVLAGCTEGSSPDTEPDTSAAASELAFSVAEATLAGQSEGPWELLHNESIEYTYSGAWQASADCVDCDGALTTFIGDTWMACAELASVGAAPGGVFDVVASSGAVPELGASEWSVTLTEGLSCEDLIADPTAIVGPSVVLGDVTVVLDDSMFVESATPTSGIGMDDTIVVNLSKTIDLQRSSARSIELTGSGGAIAAQVTIDGRSVRVRPDAPLREFQTQYTLRVEGLVATDGAVMPGPYSHVFRTAQFDEDIFYVLYTEAYPSSFVLSLPGPDYDTPRMQPELDDYPPQLWRFEPAGSQDAWLMKNSWTGAGEAVQAGLEGQSLSMRSTNAASTSQQWRFRSVGGSWRISSVALSDGVVLDAGSDNVGGVPTRMMGIGSASTVRWQLERTAFPVVD